MYLRKLMVVGIVSFIPVVSAAKDLRSGVEGDQSKIELFAAKNGAVIVKSFEEVGGLSGLYSTSLKVEAREFIDASTGKREMGVAVEVRKDEGRFDKDHTSYVDYDELDSLLAGIKYIKTIGRDTVKFNDFEAGYKTRGGLSVATFTSVKGILVAVKSGRIGGVTSYYNLDDLPKLAELISKAKARLDAAK